MLLKLKIFYSNFLYDTFASGIKLSYYEKDYLFFSFDCVILYPIKTMWLDGIKIC